MKIKSTTNQIENREMCKVEWKTIYEDIRRFNVERIQTTIKNSNNLQSACRNIMTSKQQINAIKNDNGEIISDRDGIVEKAAIFYEEL